MKMKLIKRAIDSARYQGSGADYRWDTEFAGFGLRVYPSGRKSFLVTYRIRGRQRFYTVGRYGELTVQQAKTKALEILARARKGEDPAAERAAYHRSPTIVDLRDKYMKEHARVHLKPATIGAVTSQWRIIVSKMGHLKVADVTRAEITKLHTDLAETPGQANQVRSVLSKAFNLAEVWGWRPDGSNPCRHVKKYKMESPERFLSPQELARLSEVLTEAEQDPSIPAPAIAAIRLLAFTGCRHQEIVKLRWQDVDFEQKCLRLPDSKTGAKIVHLNSVALEVLASLEPKEGNPHVIYSHHPGRPKGHLKSLDRFWRLIREKAGLEGVRLHDLRHTYASYGVGKGLSLHLVGKVLGHAKAATTERYAHLADSPIRDATEQIGAEIAAAMSAAPKAEVIPIGKPETAAG